MTGDLVMNNANIVFEGATADDFETTLTVTDPTADRTIALPNVSGTVVTTGDTGTVTSTMIVDGTIVNADVNASAAIAGTKISPDFGSQNVTTTGKIEVGTVIDLNANGSAYFASNVGIGTQNPAGALDVGAVSGAVTAGDLTITTGSTAAKVTIGRLSSTGSDNTSFRIRDRVDRDVLTVDPSNFVYSQASGERLRIDSSGRLLVGTSSARAIEPYGLGGDGQIAHTYESVGDTAPGPGIALGSSSITDRMGPYLYLFRSRGGSVGSNTSVSSGDNLGTIPSPEQMALT
ncbi:hypothetical protein [uncultured phage MedDCM-OCT-S08-C1441]|nr:hypothetical protein [uncultured phage MedDCM-OCT-S08-C1441]